MIGGFILGSLRGCDSKSVSFLLFFILMAIPSLIHIPDFSYSQINDDIPQDLVDKKIVFSSLEPQDAAMSIDIMGRLDVTWKDSRDGNEEIYYLKVDSNGYKLNDDMRITFTQTNSTDPAICSGRNKTTTLAWTEIVEEETEIRYSSLLYDGGDIEFLVDNQEISSVKNITTKPVLGKRSDGSSILLWAEQLGGGNTTIKGAWLDPFDGENISVKELYRFVGEVNHIDFEAINETEWAIAWNGQYNIGDSLDKNYGVFFSRFSDDGRSLMQPTRKTISGNSTKPDMEIVDKIVNLVFSSDRYALSGIMYTSFELDGKDIVDDIPLTDDSNYCIHPSIRYDGNSVLSIVWYQKEEDDFLLYQKESDLGESILQGPHFLLADNVMMEENLPCQVFNRLGDMFALYIKDDVNNGIHLINRMKPDLIVEELILFSSGRDPIIGERSYVNVTMFNSWSADIQNVLLEMKIYKNDLAILIKSKKIDISAGSQMSTDFSWIPKNSGSHDVYVNVNEEGLYNESNFSNNEKNISVNIGSQDYEIDMMPPLSGVFPGERSNVTVSVENLGSVPLEMNLTILGDRSDWFDIKDIYAYVEIGAEREFRFPFRSDEDTLSGDYLLLVEGRSLRDKEDVQNAHCEISIRPVYDSSVDFGNYQRELDPGSSNELELKVTNRGNTPVTYTLSGNMENDWNLTYRDKFLPVQLPVVEPGETLNFDVSMDVPYNISPGMTAKLSLRLENEEAGRIFTGDYNLTISQYPYPKLVMETESIKMDESWQPLDFNITVENIGNVRDIFVFTTTIGNLDWDVKIMEPYEGQAPLSPGENITVVVHISPPDIPMVGIQSVKFNVKPVIRSGNSASKTMLIEIGEIYSVTIKQKDTSIITDHGKSHRIMFSFTNTGNMDADFAITLSGPGSDMAMIDPMGGEKDYWNETDPVQVQAGGNFNFYIEIMVPEDTNKNTLEINVTCVQDTSVFDVGRLRYQIPQNESSNLILVGSGIAMVLALGIILAIIMKHLRNKRTNSQQDLMDEEFDDEDEI